MYAVPEDPWLMLAPWSVRHCVLFPSTASGNSGTSLGGSRPCPSLALELDWSASIRQAYCIELPPPRKESGHGGLGRPKGRLAYVHFFKVLFYDSWSVSPFCAERLVCAEIWFECSTMHQ